MTQEKTIIRINWRGPFVVEDIREPEAKHAKPSFRKCGKTYRFDQHGEDIGVYQIYGNHLLYGRDVLLYIGMAPKTSFAARIKAHMNDWGENWCDKNTVHVGTLGIKSGEKPHSKPPGELIHLAERLLIFHHSPAYNSANVGTVCSGKGWASEFLKANNVSVKNHGDRRCLERTVKNPAY